MSDSELAVRPQAGVPMLPEYGEDTGAGHENQSAATLSIPFLALLQDLSPQVTGAKGKPIDGAKAGKLFNTVTEELYGDAVSFVPAHFDHLFTAWTPRTKGGGFKGRKGLADPVVLAAIQNAKAFGKYQTPEGDDLVETFYLYGVIGETDPTPIVIGFTSTKIGVFKKWNSRIHAYMMPGDDGRKARPPYFANSVVIKTERQTNAKGSFFNFVIEPANGDIAKSLLRADDPRYIAARTIRNLVLAGKAQAAEETQNSAGNADGSDIPF